MERINQRLDIVYLLNKLVELDKLKFLLLDKDQERLLEYIPQPIIHYSSKKREENIQNVRMIKIIYLKHFK